MVTCLSPVRLPLCAEVNFMNRRITVDCSELASANIGRVLTVVAVNCNPQYELQKMTFCADLHPQKLPAVWYDPLICC